MSPKSRAVVKCHSLPDGHSWPSRTVTAAVVAHQGETTQLAVIFFSTPSYLSRVHKKPSPSQIATRLLSFSIVSQKPVSDTRGRKMSNLERQPIDEKHLCAAVRNAKHGARYQSERVMVTVIRLKSLKQCA